MELHVINLKDESVHEVRKYIISDDGQENIWSNTWYGHHVIGRDCEWVQSTPKIEAEKREKARKELGLIDIANWLNEKGYRRGMDVYLGEIAGLIKSFVDEYEQSLPKEPIPLRDFSQFLKDAIKNKSYQTKYDIPCDFDQDKIDQMIDESVDEYLNKP